MHSFWQIGYCAREALANIRRHMWPSLMAVSSIAALLFLAGLGTWTWMSFQRTATSWKEKARLIVYLRDDAAPAQRENIAKTLSGQKEVQTVRLVSKTDALARMRSSLDGQQDLLEGLEGNPLPASYEVTLKPEARRVAALDRLATAVKGLPGVEEIEYGRLWLVKLDALSTMSGTVGLLGIILLAAVLLLIINNTSKLSLYARQEELEILKLVGATPLLLRGPYVIEGALKGLLGGVLSGSVVILLHTVVGARYGTDFKALFGFWPSMRFAWAVGGSTVILGLTLGIIGGANAVRHAVRRLP